MDKVNEMLFDLSKEEVIKRFVSEEFNRFLDYYSNAGNINADTTKADQGSEGGKFSRRKKGKSSSRIIFNVGKGKGLNKKDVIDLLVNASGRKDLEIGQIDIFKRASSVEVEDKFAKKVINELNKLTYKGVNIEAEENYEFAGNDFRDRNKGPRGKKKKRQRIAS
jgi:ATP-dependent RNA helicase DeaD